MEPAATAKHTAEGEAGRDPQPDSQRKNGDAVQNCNLLTGYASLETLYRSLYASKDLAERYGLPFEYTNITDVPTYSGSYPSVLASSGVKYWVAAANKDRAPIFFYDHWNEKPPFWWVGPDGKKVLFWYSRHSMQVQTLFGLPPQLNAVRESLPIYLQAYSNASHKPDIALIYGTQVENTDLSPSTAPGQLTVHAAGGGKCLGLEKMPWGQSIRLTSSSTNTPHINTEILLFDGEKKIEFRYDLQKDNTT